MVSGVWHGVRCMAWCQVYGMVSGIQEGLQGRSIYPRGKNTIF